MSDPLSNPKRLKPNPLEGAALVIVLSCVVLLTALAIGMLNRVEADRASASAYRGSTLTRNLAEYAINVVMAQISSATKSDPTLAWASQPGAIRTYSATSANLQAIHKLYSAPDMVVAAFPTSDTSLTGWANNSALYTDLNALVVSGGRTNYPILDPAATNTVQGFAITSAPTTASQSAPMPVSWLYVLEDGTLAAPTSSAGNNTVTVTGATAANPIVGRIAFWTDDDTCKININTASGAPWGFSTTNITDSKGFTTSMPANYWEPPILVSRDDQNLAYCQPWAGEYQRYPGHPATVSLSAVYTNLTTNQIMDLAPRINYGSQLGSRWGSVALPSPTDASKLPDDAARLYANVDELLYATNRSATGTNSLTPSDVEKGRFFLTASSRAPDVTLFNTPRLLLWPITSSSGSTNKMTPYDKLIAFCGTVGAQTNIGGTNSYYFTRFDPYSTNNDYNVNRNQTLLAYLSRMTTQALPGFGGSSGILGKYNAFAANESDQIITEIFDYIRCMNCKDTSLGNNTNYFYAPNPEYSVIYPTKTANTMGFGRFPTISKLGLLFHFNEYSTNSTGATNGATLCARLLVEPFIASAGFPNPSPYIGSGNVADNTGNTNAIRYVINNLDALQWGTNASSYTNIFPSNTPTYQPFWSSVFGKGQRGGRLGIFTSPILARNDTNLSPIFSTNANNLFFRSSGDVSLSVCFATNTNSPSTWYTNQVINFRLPNFTNTVSDTTQGTTNWNRHTSWNTDTNQINPSSRLVVSGPGGHDYFQPNDVVRNIAVWHGDYRLVAAQPIVGSTNYSTNSYYGSTKRGVHNFYMDGSPKVVSTLAAHFGVYAGSTNALDTSVQAHGHYGGDLLNTGGVSSGDFDNSDGYFTDGPYIGFCSEGNIEIYGGGSAYFGTAPANDINSLPGPAFYSPNRLAPSAGILGSLPTGVKSQTPWQTLLFRPTALTTSSHRGATSPPDYLLLDLFNMPIVEPYAISEPLSTAGRVNMNYQILPFTWIKRSTALQAALHTEKLIAINTSSQFENKYRGRDIGGLPISGRIRYNLNLNTNGGTLQGFENRFAANDIFRSAAEICSIPLVPTNAPSSPTYSSMSSWWGSYRGTGDNSKERSYARIFPKLTTKSNTYTVHYRVEVLKKNPSSSSQSTWADGTDKVISTYRGSTTIERYVNPRDSGLPDYASITPFPPTGSNALPNFYKFRILGERQFNP